ncbi:hypothetical protein EVAR_86774_1 [Eumeta japonica]|uniref:Uncharacterized protein n=1 Tax=Eumeta variegata TaxID=151549 RepID=A0A4C1W123_EUMVA|nr:hypothetical protein EVAR_86774_1 [Eumeta japonica]
MIDRNGTWVPINILSLANDAIDHIENVDLPAADTSKSESNYSDSSRSDVCGNSNFLTGRCTTFIGALAVARSGAAGRAENTKKLLPRTRSANNSNLR